MPIVWFDFFSAENKSARNLFIAFLILLNGSNARAIDESSFIDSTATASSSSEAPTPAPSVNLQNLPEWETHFIQKSANGNTFQIGDRISLYVMVSPELVQNQTHFQMKPLDSSKSLEDDGLYLDPNPQVLTGTLRFIISPLQPGSKVLPPLLILKDDETPVAKTSPITIQVADHQKKDPVPELKDLTPIGLAAKYKFLIALLLLAKAAVFAYFIRRYLKARALKKQVSSMAPPKKDPEHVVALQELERLYRTHTELQLKPIAFGVSDILKTFFSVRFQIDAREATTDEMLALLRKESISKEDLKEITNLFSDLDFIKFTKAELAPAEAKHQYQDFKTHTKMIIEKWASRGQG